MGEPVGQGIELGVGDLAPFEFKGRIGGELVDSLFYIVAH